jgi:hypothetical protein
MMSEFEDLSIGIKEKPGEKKRPFEFSTETQRHRHLENRRMEMELGVGYTTPPGATLGQINDALETYLDRMKNVQKPPTKRAPQWEYGFEVESFGDVTGVDPTEVKGTSYWDAGNWLDKAQKIGAAAKALPIGGNLPFAMYDAFKLGGAASQNLPEDASPTQALKEVGMEIVKPVIEGAQAVQEITSPATGALAMQPSWLTGLNLEAREVVQARYNTLKSQGLDTVSAYASAWESAVEAGEISGKEQLVLEALTDPLELGPGGLAVGAVKKLATGAGAAFAKTTLTAGARGAIGKGDNIGTGLDGFVSRSGNVVDEGVAATPDVPVPAARQQFDYQTGERILPSEGVADGVWSDVAPDVPTGVAEAAYSPVQFSGGRTIVVEARNRVINELTQSHKVDEAIVDRMYKDIDESFTIAKNQVDNESPGRWDDMTAAEKKTAVYNESLRLRDKPLADDVEGLQDHYNIPSEIDVDNIIDDIVNKVVDEPAAPIGDEAAFLAARRANLEKQLDAYENILESYPTQLRAQQGEPGSALRSLKSTIRDLTEEGDLLDNRLRSLAPPTRIPTPTRATGAVEAAPGAPARPTPEDPTPRPQPASPRDAPESFSDLPQMEGFAVSSTESIIYKGRRMVLVELPDGNMQPFYKRTGQGGPADEAPAGTWVPFDGILPSRKMGMPKGWVNKGAYATETNVADPLYRFGTEQNKLISNSIKRFEASLPATSRRIDDPSEVNKWLGVSDEITEQGPGLGIAPAVRERPPRAIPDEGVGAGTPPETPTRDLTVGPEGDNIPPGQGTKHAMAKAEQFEQIDAPGFMGTLIESIPPVRKAAFWARPRNQIPKPIQTARVAEVGTRAELSTKYFASRWPILQRIDEVFRAKDVATPGSRGGKVDVLFLGRQVDVVGIEHTVFDIAQRPDLYALNEAQLKLMSDWRKRMDGVIREVNDNYGADIGEFTPSNPSGVFLSNVDVGEDLLAKLDITAGQAVRIGRKKTRVFDTAAKRIEAARVTKIRLTEELTKVKDKLLTPLGARERDRLVRQRDAINTQLFEIRARGDFVPETDIAKLLEGMDEVKATMASREVFKNGSGGLTRVQVVDIVHPRIRHTRNRLTRKVQNLRARLKTAERKSSANAKEIKKNETLVKNIQKRAKPIEERVKELDRDYGFELSHLSGQLHELTVAVNKAATRGAHVSVRELEQGKLRSSIVSELESAIKDLDTIRRRYKALDTGSYQLVQDGVHRYYLADSAKAAREIRESSSSSLARLLENMRNTAFAGDLGPLLGQHLPMYAMFNPRQAITRMVGAGKNSKEAGDLWRTFRNETMVKAVNEDLQGYMDLAFYSGNPIGGRTATEFAGGLLNKIPGFTRANEAMFSVVMRQMKASFDTQLKSLASDGVTGEAAKALAADAVTKIIPLWHPARLGLSPARAAAIRSVPTSVSFLIRPGTMITEASTALGKKILGKKLTPNEKLSLNLMLKMAATVSTLSAATASAAALRDGRDPVKAALAAVNPASPEFATVDLGGTFVPGMKGRKIPLGGPFRSMIRMIVPRKVDGVAEWVPFAGVRGFVQNRVTPGLQVPLRLVANRDYYGGEIRKGHFPEQILRSLMFAAEGISPLTVGAGLSGFRRELSAADTLRTMGGQFIGQDVREISPWQQRNITVEQWAKEQKIDRPISSYMDLYGSEKKAFDAAYPEESQRIKEEMARQARQGIKKAVAYAHLEQSNTDRLRREAAIAQEIQSEVSDKNHINEDEFRDRYASIQQDAATERAVLDDVYKLYKDTDELPENELDRALMQYYDAFEDARTEGSEFLNFDLLDDIMVNLEENVWNEAQIKHIEKETGLAEHAPLVQEFLDDRDAIAESGYFDVSRDMLKKYGLEGVHREYMRSSDKTEFLKNYPLLKMKLKSINKRRRKMRANNPDMEQLLWKWGYVDTAENSSLGLKIAEYRRAYGGQPNNRLGITNPLPAMAP